MSDLSEKFSKLEYFRTSTLLLACFIFLITVFAILYIFMQTNIFSQIQPFFIFFGIPIVAIFVGALPWYINCFFTHFAFFWFFIIFLFLGLADVIDPNSVSTITQGTINWDGSRTIVTTQVHGVTWPCVYFVIIITASYIISYLLRKLSRTMKIELYSVFKNKTYTKKDEKYEEEVIRAFEILAEQLDINGNVLHTNIDDIFIGEHNSKKFKLIECKIGHYIRRNRHQIDEIIDFNGTLLIADLGIKNTSSLVITENNFMNFRIKGLRIFFKRAPLSIIESITKYTVNSNVIVIDNNFLYYWKPHRDNKYEFSIFTSINENIKKIIDVDNEINDILKIIDVIENRKDK